MNEIELKRKELVDNTHQASGDNTEVCSQRDFEEHILEGFDLGVELARKEFLEFLESDEINHLRYEADIGGEHGDYEPLENKIKELKQSLGGGE